MGWKGSVLPPLFYVVNLCRKARGPNAGDGRKPHVERSAAVSGHRLRRAPGALLMLAAALTLLLSGDGGVAQAQSVQEVVLVSNTGQIPWNAAYEVGNASGLLATQGFHTGDDPGGYTLSTVGIGLLANQFSGEETLTLHIYSSNSDGTANALLYTLSPPATPGSAISTPGELAESPAPPTAEPGLTSTDVEEAIRAALSDMPQPELGLSKSEVEEIVKAALADAPQPQTGLPSAEAEQIARGVVASIPPKSAPADYTKFFVNNAVSRYETQGLDATLAYYNREESIDGQWHVFIIDENDLVIGHPDAHRLGLEVKGWVGTDAKGVQLPSSVTFATSDTSKTFTFTANDDPDNDSEKSVLLGFGTLPVRMNKGTPSKSMVKITDNYGTDHAILCATLDFWEGTSPGAQRVYLNQIDNDVFTRNGVDYWLAGINVTQNSGHAPVDDININWQHGYPERTRFDLRIHSPDRRPNGHEGFRAHRNEWLDWILHVAISF